MKLVPTLIALLVVGTVFGNKAPHKVFGEYASWISKATSITVYQIEKYPVVSADQQPDITYIFDYGVNKIYDHAPKSVDSLSQHLLDSTQFVFDDSRSCPFVGKYAVQFKKGKKHLTLIFSESPCYKMIIFCPGTNIDKKHIDLGENNKIYESLLPLVTDKN